MFPEVIVIKNQNEFSYRSLEQKDNEIVGLYPTCLAQKISRDNNNKNYNKYNNIMR